MKKRTTYLALTGALPVLVSGLGMAVSALHVQFFLLALSLVITSVLGMISIVRSWTLLSTLTALMLVVASMGVFVLILAFSPVILL